MSKNSKKNKVGNPIHRLEHEELEQAIIEYLAAYKGRHDLVTMMLESDCSFAIEEDGELTITKIPNKSR